jgi:hypothetical protein
MESVILAMDAERSVLAADPEPLTDEEPRPRWPLTVLALPFLPFVFAWRGIRWLFGRAIPAVAKVALQVFVVLVTPVRLLWIWMVVRPARWLGSVLAEPMRALGRVLAGGAVSGGLHQIGTVLTGR